MVAPMTIHSMFDAMIPRYPELRGQVALVTGSSRNIGLGIATRLGREGMRLVIHGHIAEEVEAAAAGLRGLGCQVLSFTNDLRQLGEVDRLFDRVEHEFGAVRVYVNNAANLRRVSLAELTEEIIDETLTLNLKVPLLASQRAANAMRSQGGGSIIFISSVGGVRAQQPGLPYGPSKGGIDALTRNLAVDLAKDGILVNAVAPGLTHTRKPGGLTEAAFAERSKLLPLGRPGELAEIAAVVAFLASPEASYITGQVICVDGGATAQLHPPGLPF